MSFDMGSRPRTNRRGTSYIITDPEEMEEIRDENMLEAAWRSYDLGHGPRPNKADPRETRRRDFDRTIG